MNDHSPINPPDSAAASPAPDLSTPLPRLPTTLPDDEIRSRLGQAARRGRLPGYKAGEPGTAALFNITDFGVPFESRLIARREPDAIAFDLTLKPLLPGVFAALLLFTVWPGVWFTESMLETYLPGTWLTRWTWWWYMILTVPFLPWAMWAAVKKSRTSARAEAEKLLERIGDALAAQEQH